MGYFSSKLRPLLTRAYGVMRDVFVLGVCCSGMVEKGQRNVVKVCRMKHTSVLICGKILQPNFLLFPGKAFFPSRFLASVNARDVRHIHSFGERGTKRGQQ